MSAQITLPRLGGPVKRSVSIDGHATSVTLEDAFWQALADLAQAKGITRAELIAAIDHARSHADQPADVGLATACRLYVLDAFRRGAKGD